MGLDQVGGGNPTDLANAKGGDTRAVCPPFGVGLVAARVWVAE